MNELLKIIVLIIFLAIFPSAMLSQYLNSSGNGSSNKNVPSSGLIASSDFQIYNSTTSPVSLTSIDWGILFPSSNISREIAVKNIGNVDGKITIETSNWSPSNASKYITLSWSMDSPIIKINEVKRIILFLYVSEKISGITSFSFDIVFWNSV